MNPRPSPLPTLVATELFVEEVEPAPDNRQRDAVGRLALGAADVIALAAALLVLGAVHAADATGWTVALAPILWGLAWMAGLYSRDAYVINKTTLDEAPRLLSVSAILAILGSAVPMFGLTNSLVALIVLVPSLVSARGVSRYLTSRTSAPERVLVIGDAASALRISRTLSRRAGLNAVVVGRMSLEPVHHSAEEHDPLLSAVKEFKAVLKSQGVTRVVIASDETASEHGLEVIRLAKASGAKVAVVPPLLNVMGSSVQYDDLGGQALLSMRPFGLSRGSRALKRTFDVAMAGLALAVLFPLLLVIAIAVRLSSHGAIIFRQTRIGRDGRTFQMMKFRTMHAGAEGLRNDLIHRNEAAPLFKIANDPRITPVGRFLRRQSLDELPQLINVLRGEMSIVGPRPLVPEEDQLFSGWQRHRNHVAPGITGPWQVLGSTRVPWEEMVTLDYLYGANWSLWLDVKLVLQTVPAIFTRRSGEYSAPAAHVPPAVVEDQSG
jgi:exopolysaccharide biosynthesis polyprenyl glycosylphosphotransferase